MFSVKKMERLGWHKTCNRDFYGTRLVRDTCMAQDLQQRLVWHKTCNRYLYGTRLVTDTCMAQYL